MTDVAVVGGGAAGLSAALFTAKNDLDTVVFDTDGTWLHKAHLFNYLGIESEDGSAFVEDSREQVESFGADIHQGEEVTAVAEDGDGFTVTTDDDRYGRSETDVTLDRDRTVEVTLTEETAIERLCEGMRTDAELLLEDVAGKVEAAYDREGYLTGEMEIGVQREYRPCVLALWAEDEGLSVREDDGGVLVYDRERLETQLTDLIEQKLPDEDEMYYDDIRERYLTVPTSNELLRDVLRQVETDVDIEWTDEKVVTA